MDSPTITRPKSLLREAAGWAPLVLFVTACLVGYRHWSDKMEASPVAPVHANFLDFMAAQSTAAQAYRQLYFQKFGRDSVASKHFEHVCASMVTLAAQDGVDPARHSQPSARACKAFAKKYALGTLPD